MRISPIHVFLHVGTGSDPRIDLKSRFSHHEGSLPPAMVRPGHVVVRHDRVLWSLQVIQFHLVDGDRAEPSPVPPAEPIDRQWPSDTLPEIEALDTPPEPCDCPPEVRWVEGGLFNLLV